MNQGVAANDQNLPINLEKVVGTKSIEQIVEEAGPAVVKIETLAKVKNQANDFLDPFDDPFSDIFGIVFGWNHNHGKHRVLDLDLLFLKMAIF